MKKKFQDNPNLNEYNFNNHNYGPHGYSIEEDSTINCPPQKIIPPTSSLTSHGSQNANFNPLNDSQKVYINQENSLLVNSQNQKGSEEIKGENPNYVEEDKNGYKKDNSTLLVKESLNAKSMHNPESDIGNNMSNLAGSSQIYQKIVNSPPPDAFVNQGISNIPGNSVNSYAQVGNPVSSGQLYQNQNKGGNYPEEGYSNFDSNQNIHSGNISNNPPQNVINNINLTNIYITPNNSQKEYPSPSLSQKYENLPEEKKEFKNVQNLSSKSSHPEQQENELLVLFYVKRKNNSYDSNIPILCLKILTEETTYFQELHQSLASKVNDAIQHKNKIFYCGGFFNEKPLDTCSIYNLITQHLGNEIHLTEGKWNVSLCTTKSKLFCLGGAQGYGKPPAKILQTCEYYEENKNFWTKTNPMNTQNCCITCCALGENFIFTFGGFKSNTYEKYNIYSDNWTQINLGDSKYFQFKRSYGCAWAYSENKILIFGGDDIIKEQCFLLFDSNNNIIQPKSPFKHLYMFNCSKPVYYTNHLFIISYGLNDGNNANSQKVYHNTMFDIDLNTLTYIDKPTDFGF